MQQEKVLEVRGTWRRWSRYEIVNSTVVPAEGATLAAYDPWDAYRSNVGRYRTVQQPYTSFLELGRLLESAEKKGVKPSKLDSQQAPSAPIFGPQNDADSLILEWCNEHGLLGLVPVLSTSIRVSDTVHHFRDGGKWFSRIVEKHSRGSSEIEHSREEDGEEDTVTALAGTGGERSLTWLSWIYHNYERTWLAEMHAFFGAWTPNEAFLPWRPLSRLFWSKYAEPVQYLADWCIVFTHSVDYLSGWRSEATKNLTFLNAAHMVLRRLAESAAPRFELYPGRKVVLDEERTPAGLLASYALMFLWDLLEDRRALRCKNCDHYFVSDEYRAAYCSTRCRNTAQSKRYRAKKEVG